MAPIFAAINEEEILFVAIPILSVLIVLMTAILTSHHRKMQRDDMEATLKMEMIQRGMSAEEIERVLAARIGSQPRPTRGYAPGPMPGAARREA